MIKFGHETKKNKQRIQMLEQWQSHEGVLIMGYEMFRLLLEHTTDKGQAKERKRRLNNVCCVESRSTLTSCSPRPTTLRWTDCMSWRSGCC